MEYEKKFEGLEESFSQEGECITGISQRAVVVSFTEPGGRWNRRIVKWLKGEKVFCQGYAQEKYSGAGLLAFESLSQLVSRVFKETDLLIFIGAVGIAVRVIAPCLAGKDKDPAVLVMDECGKHVISLLSGHLGGANEWCRRVSDFTGAEAVITTATDLHHRFAVDVFAKENDLVITDMAAAKEVSSRILQGDRIGLCCELPWEGEIPEGICLIRDGKWKGFDCGIYIGKEPKKLFKKTCCLLSRHLVVGIGCRKNKSREELENFLHEVFLRNSLSECQISCFASIDRKAGEEGILQLAKARRVPFFTFSAKMLQTRAFHPDGFTDSEFVRQTVGVGNVCERAACLAGKEAVLAVPKQGKNGMTIAVAEDKKKVRW